MSAPSDRILVVFRAGLMRVEYEPFAREPFWKLIYTAEYQRYYRKEPWAGSRWSRAEPWEVPEAVLLAMIEHVGRLRALGLKVEQALLREGLRRNDGTTEPERTAGGGTGGTAL